MRRPKGLFFGGQLDGHFVVHQGIGKLLADFGRGSSAPPALGPSGIHVGGPFGRVGCFRVTAQFAQGSRLVGVGLGRGKSFNGLFIQSIGPLPILGTEGIIALPSQIFGNGLAFHSSVVVPVWWWYQWIFIMVSIRVLYHTTNNGRRLFGV